MNTPNLQLKSNQHCYQLNHHVIRIYGFAKDPESNNDYMLIMQYASGGNLQNYLQENFTKFITWNKEKLEILWQISEGYLY